MGKQKVCDEQIISALLTNGTTKAAAEACNISTRTVYQRMQDADFRALYSAAKSDILRKAVNALNDELVEAVKTVIDIMHDTEANPATRLQAAQTVLNNAMRYSERLNADETGVTILAENSMFSVLGF